ncbi:MAG: amidohydrolase family protein [Flavobacteriales bacterium]|nr:amidohydrolase family protein [Flavobacteriales bacterium]
MKSLKRLILVLLAFAAAHLANAQTPAPAQKGRILLLGGTAHLGTGDKIEGAAVGFENGIITFVGSEKNVTPAEWDEVIDTHEKHIYPGFIAPNSQLGLMEIEAVRATKDYAEVGTFKPHIRSAIAFNTDSEITPTVRSNGVLMGQITPAGGTISGTSSIMQFDAWNWEDAIVVEGDGIHLNWPLVYHKHRQDGQVNIQKIKTYEQQLQEIQSYFQQAQAYAKLNSETVDVRMEAMKGLWDGTLALYVHADDVQQITEAVALKKQFGIARMVIVGGYDSHLVADMLRDNEVAVMVRRTHTLPRYAEDDVDLPFKLPKLLEDEGVLYCLENSGSMSEMGTRNLPFLAGTAVAYGLTYEQGVKAITYNTARILGIADRLGSIEKGKEATLIVSDGDALDMRTNHISHAWINGRTIDLDNRQEQLYRKYESKYKREGTLEE